MPKNTLIAGALALLGVVVLGGYYLMNRPGPAPVADPVEVAETDETGAEEAAEETVAEETAAEEAASEDTGAGSAALVPGDAPGPYLDMAVDGQHTDGVIRVDLLQDTAPGHVEQMVALAREGFYDGIYFHRVIDGFMAQTGDGEFGKVGDDPRRAGTGASGRPDLAAEFSDVPFTRGIVGMARSQDPNSANSQFFIMFDDGPFLNGNYTVVGYVTDGLDVLDGIKRGDGSTLQVTGEPDQLVSVTVSE